MGIWWTQENAATARAALIQSGLVERAANVEVLGEGFGSMAFEASGVVILIGKNQIGLDALRLSTGLLPELGPALTVAVPRPLWSVDSGELLPWGAWAYEKLPGRLMTDADCCAHEASLAEDVAAFLAALHSFPAELGVALGVPSRESFWEMLRKVRSDIDEALRERLALHEYPRVQAWWDAFAADESLQAAPPALVYGDLYPDNLLVTRWDTARWSNRLG